MVQCFKRTSVNYLFYESRISFLAKKKSRISYIDSNFHEINILKKNEISGFL